ncbi:hypothetical protein BDP81DRAFT_19382 [Colletotrichum phormii]|uniref:Uncharacterized protein n=1 Tax=Colletotrichum phormii TaxID=359342 RepID=A0AAJ0A562_9PEZI|nr:uncharacterized protein BDP81DRAFT_19382 [Colletotrichum phormii]KAK1656294.1 hypothetical protein BDP81DRAFT_19382 [Colletotrichum phormii]
MPHVLDAMNYLLQKSSTNTGLLLPFPLPKRRKICTSLLVPPSSSIPSSPLSSLKPTCGVAAEAGWMRVFWSEAGSVENLRLWCRGKWANSITRGSFRIEVGRKVMIDCRQNEEKSMPCYAMLTLSCPTVRRRVKPSLRIVSFFYRKGRQKKGVMPNRKISRQVALEKLQQCLDGQSVSATGAFF